MKKSNIIKLIATVLLILAACYLFMFEPPLHPTAFQSDHNYYGIGLLALGVTIALTTFKPGKKI